MTLTRMAKRLNMGAVGSPANRLLAANEEWNEKMRLCGTATFMAVTMATPALPDTGAVAASVKDWAAGNPRFAALLASGLPTVKALSRWSTELLRASQTADALVVLRSALALTPNDPLLWTNYGALLNQQNSPGESVACLEHSLTLLQRQPDTWVLLGLVRQKLGDSLAAETAYRMALQQEPNSIAAWQLLGLLKQELRDYPTAAACLSACIKAGGSDAALFANLAKLHYQLGQFPESSRHVHPGGCPGFNQSALSSDGAQKRLSARHSPG